MKTAYLKIHYHDSENIQDLKSIIESETMCKVEIILHQENKKNPIFNFNNGNICPNCKMPLSPAGGVIGANLNFYKCFYCGYELHETDYEELKNDIIELGCDFNINDIP